MNSIIQSVRILFTVSLLLPSLALANTGTPTVAPVETPVAQASESSVKAETKRTQKILQLLVNTLETRDFEKGTILFTATYFQKLSDLYQQTLDGQRLGSLERLTRELLIRIRDLRLQKKEKSTINKELVQRDVEALARIGFRPEILGIFTEMYTDPYYHVRAYGLKFEAGFGISAGSGLSLGKLRNAIGRNYAVVVPYLNLTMGTGVYIAAERIIGDFSASELKDPKLVPRTFRGDNSTVAGYFVIGGGTNTTPSDRGKFQERGVGLYAGDRGAYTLSIRKIKKLGIDYSYFFQRLGLSETVPFPM